MKKLLTVVLSVIMTLTLVVGVIPQTAITAYADDFIIYSQPRSTTCIEGAEVYFTIAVTGLTGEATYQWQVARNMGPDADCVEDGPYVDCFEDEGYDTRNNFKVLATMEKNGNWYRCKVTDSTGTVQYSTGAYLVVEADPYVKLDTPVVTASNDPATGKVKLTWNAIEGADSYTVYRAQTIDGEYNIVCGNYITETSFIHEFSSPGVTYYYKVAAIKESDSRCNSMSAAVIGIGGKPVATVGTPTLSATNVSSTGKIKLSWNAVDGAEKYEVYRATSKTGEYKLLTTTTKTSVTNTKVNAGETYYYKVKAIHSNSSATSAFSTAVGRTVDLPQPVVTATNIASTGKIQLKWDAVSGAKEYKIYRSTSKTGTYKLLKTTTGTSFKNTSVNAGETYYYKVKAFHSNSSATSVYSTAVGRTVDLPQPTLTVTNIASTGKIQLKWNAIEGAKEYKVYRSTTKGGEYKLLKTTTVTSLKNTSVNAGETYYYKVMAVHSNSSATSAYSTAVGRTVDLPQPVASVALNSKGKPRVTWNAVSGAKEYEVYRATSSSGTYTKLYTTTGTSMTNSSATAGKTYYYKVKAIHTNSSANSAYSVVKSVKSK